MHLIFVQEPMAQALLWSTVPAALAYVLGLTWAASARG